MGTQFGGQLNQIPQFPVFRTKRGLGGPDLSPAGIKKMKAKMMAKISNVTCVMKELNYMDENNKPNYAYVEEKFANCMPVEKANSVVKRELGTTIAFMKCMHMKKALVCMKHDLRKHAAMMGFEADVNTSEGEDMIDEIHTMLTEGPESML